MRSPITGAKLLVHFVHLIPLWYAITGTLQHSKQKDMDTTVNPSLISPLHLKICTLDVNNWKVNLEACTSSDHHAIEYSIRTPHIERQQPRESTYLFNNKTANWDKFHDQFDIQFNSSGLHQVDVTPDPRSIDSTVELLTKVIQETCFKTMKLRGNHKPYTVPA